MTKSIRYIAYAFIAAICVIAICVGVFAVAYKDDETQNSKNTVKSNETEEQEEINTDEDKEEFLALFENQLFASNFDDSNIEKIVDDQDLVFSGAELKQSEEDKFDIDVNIPQININSELATKYNETTQKIFVNKVNEILSNQEDNGFVKCKISYTAYINNSVLSVAIKEDLTENDEERTMIQTYNYNLDTNEEVKASDIIEQRQLDSDKIQDNINKLIEKESENSENNVERDIENEAYKVENIVIFIEGPNGDLFIIYPYGNGTQTTEMDVLKV